jgi:hypothetical protein
MAAPEVDEAGKAFPFVVSGFDEWDRIFAALGEQRSKAAMRKALRGGALFIRVQLERAAPRGEKFKPAYTRLHERIAVTGKPKRNRRTSILIGQFDIVVAVQSLAPHSHLVEYGHRLVRAIRDGRTGRVLRKRVVGWVAAKPFIRPTFETHKDVAAEMVVEGFVREIERIGGLRIKRIRSGRLSAAEAETLLAGAAEAA